MIMICHDCKQRFFLLLNLFRHPDEHFHLKMLAVKKNHHHHQENCKLSKISKTDNKIYQLTSILR